MAESYVGLRATVMGLGTRGGGLGVARFLAEQGAVVTVTDGRTADALAEPMAQLADLPVRYVLGGHEERDFTREGADIIVRNPGVSRRSAYLELARSRGIPIEMEMSLFFRACPAPIIGITGTKGKTSTAALCATMLRAWDGQTVLAGNMGVSALAQLPRIGPATPVVIELSSWQLEALDEHRLAPRVAVLTNISEDHLDAYDGFADYAETKRSIARHLSPDDVFVVNADDHETWRAAQSTNARTVPFGLGDRGADGMWLDSDVMVWRRQGEETRIAIPENPDLVGEHQLLNSAAAAAAALALGAPIPAIERGLRDFAGVENRMERVATIDDVRFVNDTSATAPVAAIAALKRFREERVHLIAGGADKRVDLVPLAVEAARSAHAIYLLDGTATPTLQDLITGEGQPGLGPYSSMDAAVRAAASAAEPGDVVLLSPGCASFGLFRDEFDRGERFRQAVHGLAATSKRTATADLPPAPAHVHFVGVGGIGMSGLARILAAWGYRVTGTDATPSEVTTALIGEGIDIGFGHEATTNAASADLVVITAAIKPNNPELFAAAVSERPIVKRAELLGMLANARRCVAVAGSHGKSSTSGMLTAALLALGADPSYAVGAVVATTGTNAAPGGGDVMVVEADEYDYSFLWLKPEVAIVTNVEYDHPDIFADPNVYEAAFGRFIGNLRPGGTLVIAGDDPGCARVLARRDSALLGNAVTFGETADVDWRLSGTEGAWLVRGRDGERVSLPLAVPGRHMARNATAALAVLTTLGYGAAAAAVALGTFSGVGRRFELKGDVAGVTVIDDYAHHPSELRANLRAARERYPTRRIWAVFQPHTFSRTKALLDDFAASFDEADRRIVLDIYPSRETDSLGISADDLIRLIPGGAIAGGKPTDAATILAAEVAAGDVVLTFGAGDVTAVGPMLLEHLRGRELDQ